MLTLVHFTAQPEPFWVTDPLKLPTVSIKRCLREDEKGDECKPLGGGGSGGRGSDRDGGGYPIYVDDENGSLRALCAASHQPWCLECGWARAALNGDSRAFQRGDGVPGSVASRATLCAAQDALSGTQEGHTIVASVADRPLAVGKSQFSPPRHPPHIFTLTNNARHSILHIRAQWRLPLMIPPHDLLTMMPITSYASFRPSFHGNLNYIG